MIKIGHVVKLREELINILKFTMQTSGIGRVCRIVHPENNDPIYNLDFGYGCTANVLSRDIVEVEDCGQKLLFW